MLSQGPSAGRTWDYELAEIHRENAGLGRISLYEGHRLGASVGRNCNFGKHQVAETAGQWPQQGHRIVFCFV